jgi:hypothetical protein
VKFVRPRIVVHDIVPGSFDVNGNPTTTPVVTQTALRDVILGNGTSVFPVLQRDGKNTLSITSLLLPAAYNDNVSLSINANGSNKIWVTVNTEALGAAGLTGVIALIEFQDPDHPTYWIPSKEGVARDSNLAANEWSLPGLGNRIIASREEHHHFVNARVRFRVLAGAADAATLIVVSWHHAGHRNWAEVIGNDPATNLEK